MLFCIEDEATPDIMVSPSVLSARESAVNNGSNRQYALWQK